jgi:peptide/nickel transport system substrate-binding protein
MHDPRVERLARQGAAGQLSRRQVLATGLRLGIATPLLTTMVMATPIRTSAAAPAGAPKYLSSRFQDTSTGTLTTAITGSIPDLDPHYAYDSGAQMVILGAYEMLVQYKDESTDEIAPMLATSWETAADGLSVAFTIPEGVTFHDGTPCDAEAVRASFERFLLQGAGPVNVISRFIDDPANFVVISPTEIQFKFAQEQPLFLMAMASSYGPFVLNTALVEEHKTEEDPWAHEFFRENMAGTGPYILEENSPNEQIVLKRFDAYHGGWADPHFDTIVIRVVPENATRRQLIEAGEIDVIANYLTVDDYAAMSTNTDLTIMSYPSTAVYWTIMNAPVLGSIEARQGFSYAFPYNELVESVYQGYIARSGPIPSTVQGYDPDVFLYQTDLVKAKELLLAAGLAEGDSWQYGVDSGIPEDATVAQLFQANLQSIGFDLEIVSYERGQYIDMIYGDSPAEDRPAFVGGWGWWPDYNDPWNQLAPNFLESSTGGGGSNGGYWVNARFEEIMAEVEVFTDESEMLALMKEAQNILTELDPPALYYGEIQWVTVLRSDIAGFVPNPLYLNGYNFRGMYRTE